MRERSSEIQRLNKKLPELTETLAECVNVHQAFLVKIRLNLIDEHTQAIDALAAQIEEETIPFRAAPGPNGHHR